MPKPSILKRLLTDESGALDVSKMIDWINRLKNQSTRALEQLRDVYKDFEIREIPLSIEQELARREGMGYKAEDLPTVEPSEPMEFGKPFEGRREEPFELKPGEEPYLGVGFPGEQRAMYKDPHTGKMMVKVDINKERAIDASVTQYTSLGPHKQMIELLQNATDLPTGTTKVTAGIGETRLPEEAITSLGLPSDANYNMLYVEDNGKGMSMETFGTHFVDIHSSGPEKAGGVARGGFGVASASFQLGGEYFRAITTHLDEDGVVRQYKMEGSPQQLRKGVELVQIKVPKDTPTGTKVMVWDRAPEGYDPQNEKQVGNAKKHLKDTARTMPSVQFSIIDPYEMYTIDRPGFEGTKPAVQVQLPDRRTTVLHRTDIRGNKITLSSAAITATPQRKVQVLVTSKGYLNFRWEHEVGMEPLAGLPEYLIMDIDSPHDVNDVQNYPFDNAREHLKKHIEDPMKEFLNENLIRSIAAARRAKLMEDWNNISDYHASGMRQPLAVFNEQGLMPENQIYGLLYNETFANVLNNIMPIFNYYREMVEGPPITHISPTLVEAIQKHDPTSRSLFDKMGIMFPADLAGDEITLGINIPHPEDTATGVGYARLRTALLLNPFGELTLSGTGITAAYLARSFLLTIQHETAHVLKRDHYVPFINAMGKLQLKTPEIERVRMVGDLANALAGVPFEEEFDESRPVSTEYIKLFNEYTATRAGARSISDSLRGTGTTASRFEEGEIARRGSESGIPSIESGGRESEEPETESAISSIGARAKELWTGESGEYFGVWGRKRTPAPSWVAKERWPKVGDYLRDENGLVRVVNEVDSTKTKVKLEGSDEWVDRKNYTKVARTKITPEQRKEMEESRRARGISNKEMPDAFDEYEGPGGLSFMGGKALSDAIKNWAKGREKTKWFRGEKIKPREHYDRRDVGGIRSTFTSDFNILRDHIETEEIGESIPEAEDKARRDNATIMYGISDALKGLGTKVCYEVDSILREFDNPADARGLTNPETEKQYTEAAIAAAEKARIQFDRAHAIAKLKLSKSLPKGIGYIPGYATEMHQLSRRPVAGLNDFQVAYDELWNSLVSGPYRVIRDLIAGAPAGEYAASTPDISWMQRKGVGLPTSPFVKTRKGGMAPLERNIRVWAPIYIQSIINMAYRRPAVENAMELYNEIGEDKPELKKIAYRFIKNFAGFNEDYGAGSSMGKFVRMLTSVTYMGQLGLSFGLQTLHLGRYITHILPDLGPYYGGYGLWKAIQHGPLGLYRQIDIVNRLGLGKQSLKPFDLMSAPEKFNFFLFFADIGNSLPSALAINGYILRAADRGAADPLMQGIKELNEAEGRITAGRTINLIDRLSPLSRPMFMYRYIPFKMGEVYFNRLNRGDARIIGASLLLGALAWYETAHWRVKLFHLSSGQLKYSTIMLQDFTRIGADLLTYYNTDDDRYKDRASQRLKRFLTRSIEEWRHGMYFPTEEERKQYQEEIKREDTIRRQRKVGPMAPRFQRQSSLYNVEAPNVSG